MPAKAPPANATTSLEMNASSVFGTPRYTRPPELEKRVVANANSKAAQNASSAFGTPRYTRPPEPEKRVVANANSKAAQNASSAFGTPRYASPPPQSPRRQEKKALNSVAQNSSSIFGTPRYTEQPKPGSLLSQTGMGELGSSQSFAPGELLMPTPRSSADGAPRSRAAQQESASMPGTKFRRPDPPPKPPPRENASSTKAQQVSSVFGTPRQYEPPPAAADKPPANDMSAKGGRNNSSVFPGQTTYKAPPMPAKAPPPPAANSKADQQRSSVFGTPRPTGAPAAEPPSAKVGKGGISIAPKPAPPAPAKYESPREYTGLRLGPPKSAERAPPLPKKEPMFTDANGKPRNAETTAENMLSSVLGGDPCLRPENVKAAAMVHSELGSTRIKMEFDGLPPDADTHRLHKAIGTLDHGQEGLYLARSACYVEYGPCSGKASGKAHAQFMFVEDGERLKQTIADAAAKGHSFFGKGRNGKGVTAKVKYDGSLAQRRREKEKGERNVVRV